MIAFLSGFAAVFGGLIAWMLRANPDLRGSDWLFEAAYGESLGWRIAFVAATLLGAPLAGAWIGMEIVTRLRPVRAMDHRVRRGGSLAAAGVAAGLLSVAGSALLLPFSDAWVPDAVVTGGLSTVFAALALLPFARRRVGHCIHCGYDLRGGALRATCPECGAVGSAG